jgi:hypothetical protein
MKRISKAKRAQAEKLFQEVQVLQAKFWDKLEELENFLGSVKLDIRAARQAAVLTDSARAYMTKIKEGSSE